MTSILDVDEAAVTASEAVLLAALRAAYPSMDLRRGTVLRELLLRPMAQLHARAGASLDELVASKSITTLAADPAATAESVNAVLANFATSLREGTKSSGAVIIRVAAPDPFTLSAGFALTGPNGAVYAMSGAASRRVAVDGADIALVRGDASGAYYYAIVDVVSTLPGSAYDVPAGTALAAGTAQIPGLISVEAYTSIGGGRAAETAAEAVVRLPVTISARGPVSAAGIEAVLTDPLHGNLYELNAISVVGAGAVMQRRGRKNALGIAVPGRVDAYLRTYGAPEYVVLQKVGTRSGAHEYTLRLAAADIPGFMHIAAVTTTAAGTAASLVAGGSLPFSFTPYYDGTGNTFHDIAQDDPSTYVGSVYQGGTLTALDVVEDAAELAFNVVVCVAPRVAEMQAYLDDSARRPFYDLLLRAPRPVLVDVAATVRATAAFDVSKARSRVADAVNATGFIGTLDGGVVMRALLESGAQSVTLGPAGAGGLVLRADIPLLSGGVTRVSGQAIRLDTVTDAEQLVHGSVCTFISSPDRVSITVRGVQ